jgi:hypothetical protein
MKPMLLPPHVGCVSVAPLLPQPVQRAHCRSLSLGASAPHRMTGAAKATGALC